MPIPDVDHKADQKKKAKDLLALHSGDNPLILPNVWDAASARIIEDAGFPAIATSSAGVAFSLGYRDGEKIPREEMLTAVARIAHAVRVPVTADVEAGYGPTPADAARTARAVVEAGAVGMNLEDATGDSEQPLVELPLQLERFALCVRPRRVCRFRSCSTRGRMFISCRLVLLARVTTKRFAACARFAIPARIASSFPGWRTHRPSNGLCQTFSIP